MSLIGAVLAEEAHTPELLELFRERLVAPRRGMLRAILARARGRHELRPEIDLDVAVSALIGAFYARYLAASKVPPGFARELVEIVWRRISRSEPRAPPAKTPVERGRLPPPLHVPQAPPIMPRYHAVKC